MLLNIGILVSIISTCTLYISKRGIKRGSKGYYQTKRWTIINTQTAGITCVRQPAVIGQCHVYVISFFRSLCHHSQYLLNLRRFESRIVRSLQYLHLQCFVIVFPAFSCASLWLMNASRPRKLSRFKSLGAISLETVFNLSMEIHASYLQFFTSYKFTILKYRATNGLENNEYTSVLHDTNEQRESMKYVYISLVSFNNKSIYRDDT